MAHPLRYTPKQIVWKIGFRTLSKLLGVGPDAMRKWYDNGIPTRHWPILVKQYDWITYAVLEDATAIARRKIRRAA